MIVSRLLFIKIKFSNGLEICFVYMYTCVGVHVYMHVHEKISILFKKAITQFTFFFNK